MEMLFKRRIFQKVAVCIFFTFIGLMGIVAVFAYSRRSGSTRQDMAEAHFIRQEASIKSR